MVPPQRKYKIKNENEIDSPMKEEDYKKQEEIYQSGVSMFCQRFKESHEMTKADKIKSRYWVALKSKKNKLRPN